MATKGKRANWSGLIVSDRPRDKFKMTVSEDATLENILGVTGRDQDGDVQDKGILWYGGTTAPTLTNYDDTPVGTILIAYNLSAPRIYIHKAQSSPAVAGDWYYVQGTQAT